MKIAVVGAGISGLTAAFRLQQRGHAVTVYEAADRPGGMIHSARIDGFIVEWGANGVLSGRTHAFDLARELGLEAFEADASAEKRYVFDGALRAMPKSPPGFAKSGLLSKWAMLRALAEPMVRRGTTEESVYDFLARRFGKQVAERFADVAVLGIYAGDPRELSLDAAFPILREIERAHGSIIKGMIRRKKAGKSIGRLSCFREGMGSLTHALAERLDVRLGHRVERLADLDADRVVVAIPTPQAAELLVDVAPDSARLLAEIPHAPIAAMVYGAPVDALPRALDGFGCLIPPRANRKIIGIVWTSAIFPTHVPDGQAALRVIIGGARQSDLVALPDETLVPMVREELSAVLGGPMPPPSFHRTVRWRQGIPQYTMGHADRLARIEAGLPAHVILAGNGLYGASVADCVARGEAVARAI